MFDVAGATTSTPVEYCQWETFEASCSGIDQVILMESARYGRMHFSRCVREDHGSIGCAADVISHLDRICSGRRRCHVTIPDSTLHAAHPCPRELMPYLEASYSCVTGRPTWQVDLMRSQLFLDFICYVLVRKGLKVSILFHRWSLMFRL